MFLTSQVDQDFYGILPSTVVRFRNLLRIPRVAKRWRNSSKKSIANYCYLAAKKTSWLVHEHFVWKKLLTYTLGIQSYSQIMIGMWKITAKKHSIRASLPFSGGDWIPRELIGGPHCRDVSRHMFYENIATPKVFPLPAIFPLLGFHPEPPSVTRNKAHKAKNLRDDERCVFLELGKEVSFLRVQIFLRELCSILGGIVFRFSNVCLTFLIPV